MAKKVKVEKPSRKAMQWKTVRGVHISEIASVCEKWTGDGWTIHSILGPLNDGFLLVMSRMLTL